MPHIMPRSSFYNNLAGIHNISLNDLKYFSQEFVCPVPQVIFKYRKRKKRKKPKKIKQKKPIPGHKIKNCGVLYDCQGEEATQQNPKGRRSSV